MASTKFPKPDRRANYANLPVTRPYKAPEQFICCFKCGTRILKSEFQAHLDKSHPGWLDQSIKRIGLHLVKK